MLSSRAVLAVSALLVVFFVSGGFSLQCYTCASLGNLNKGCSDPFDKKDIPTENCANNSVCLKYKYELNKTEIVSRHCAPKVDKVCDQVQNSVNATAETANVSLKWNACSPCEKDLCNSSATSEKSLILFLAVFTYLFFFFVKTVSK